MLTVNRKKRPSAAKLLEHDFFKIAGDIVIEEGVKCQVVENLKGFNAKSAL